ncbi:MAG TPA: hypothetical protein ENJ10_05595 [Caldithrix abyssi]|uniref:Cytochrome c n=1 Tax=Caldithrix abyssi TaxID=187145 RepID=A0A7V1LYX3_CALAY|nr:hypothetical protein [Caldithrix abyssi]
MNRYMMMSLAAILILGIGAHAQTPSRQTIELPPRYGQLLKEEMNKIDAGMKMLLSLMVRGETERAAALADTIHNSFILKQSLNKDELKELVSYLPGDFVQLDRTFHGNAKKLAEALRRSDIKESGQIYGAMFNGCISCHSRFAADKFPGLINTSK